MRTISAKYAKGQEPPRTWRDSLRLIRYIVSAGLNYVFVGYAIRRAWYARQRAGEKYYVDEPTMATTCCPGTVWTICSPT